MREAGGGSHSVTPSPHRDLPPAAFLCTRFRNAKRQHCPSPPPTSNHIHLAGVSPGGAARQPWLSSPSSSSSSQLVQLAEWLPHSQQDHRQLPSPQLHSHGEYRQLPAS